MGMLGTICSKLDAMAIYVVNQACGNDIRACVQYEKHCGNWGIVFSIFENILYVYNFNLTLNFSNKWVSMKASINMGQGGPCKGFSIK